jgi:transcriptional regulator GlxA family with amidase domain
MHRVVVIAVPPVLSFDLSIPELIFRAVQIDGRPAYDIRVCTAEPGILPSDGAFDVVVREGLEAVAEGDTVMVTGGAGREDVSPRSARAPSSSPRPACWRTAAPPPSG